MCFYVFCLGVFEVYPRSYDLFFPKLILGGRGPGVHYLLVGFGVLVGRGLLRGWQLLRRAMHGPG